ncbi:hypothetical protein GFS60_04356 [Rhodococcus sp. WAY2]|nr:hypothetical protein GFS60_04356 [Rhodococcus sp. WAY2]
MTDNGTITGTARFTGALFAHGDEGYENARIGRVFHSRTFVAHFRAELMRIRCDGIVIATSTRAAIGSA